MEGSFSLRIKRLLLFIQNDKIAILILTLITLGTRMFRLSFHDIWYDEAYSFFGAIGFFKNAQIFDFNPFIYPWFLKNWTSFFGNSLFSLRLPSAFFSAASLYPLFRLVAMVGNRKAAWLVSLIFILSPFQIWYSQEARSYSFIIFEAILFWYVFTRYVAAPRIRYAYSCFFVLVLSVCTDYRLGFFLLFFVVLHFRSLDKRLAFFCMAALLVSLVLCLRVFMAQADFFKQISFWAPVPLWISPLITFNNMLFGYNRLPFFNSISLSLTAVLLIILGLAHGPRMGMIKSLVFLPVVFGFVFSKLSVSIYVDRFFAFISPFFYVGLILSLNSLKNLFLKKALFAALFLPLIAAAIFYYTDTNEERCLRAGEFWSRMHVGVPFKHPYQAAVRFLTGHYQRHECILFSNRDFPLPFQYYSFFVNNNRGASKDEMTHKLVCVPEFMAKNFFESRIAAKFSKEASMQVLSEGWLEGNKREGISRYWLVTTTWYRGQAVEHTANAFLVRSFMSRCCRKIKTFEIDGITVDLFEF
ncbi:MAG: glycosyltransferase family 39 protein [Candidatus Omnitrophota bacterium]